MKKNTNIFFSLFLSLILVGCGTNPNRLESLITYEKKDNTVSVIEPSILILPINENVFVARVTNHDTEADIVPNQLHLKVATNVNWPAIACLRERGSMRPCGSTDTAFNLALPVSTFMSIDKIIQGRAIPKNGGTIEFEVVLYSNYMFPKGGKIQVDVSHLGYLVAQKQEFIDRTWTSSIVSIQ